MTGAAKGTVMRLLVSLGKACGEYQNNVLINLPCARIECDEIWSFCYAKQKNVPDKFKNIFGYGSIWTWVAIDPDSKLVPSWYVGHRDFDACYDFLSNLEPRLTKKRIQISTDGFESYKVIIPIIFHKKIDYGVIQKNYGVVRFETDENERRYSPNQCVGSTKIKIKGRPKKALISTSFIERQNLSMRMSMRRFTRLTNGFSKKVENLEAAISLHYMYYNFCRAHHSLSRNASRGITPAMAAKVSKHQWSVQEIVELFSN